MKVKKIVWRCGNINGLDFLKPENDDKPNENEDTTHLGISRSTYGCINDSFQFEIRREGKKVPKYVLLSFPIQFEYFTRANNSKVIGEFETPEEASQKAQDIMIQFVSSLIQ